MELTVQLSQARHVVERQQKLSRAARRLEVELGREPTKEELAEATGLPIQHVDEALVRRLGPGDHHQPARVTVEPVDDAGPGRIADAGFLKIDLLGLGMLSCVEDCATQIARLDVEATACRAEVTTLSDDLRAREAALASTRALRLELARNAQGLWLNWNTVPGCLYQVQFSTNAVTWQNVGRVRFAPGGL